MKLLRLEILGFKKVEGGKVGSHFGMLWARAKDAMVESFSDMAKLHKQIPASACGELASA